MTKAPYNPAALVAWYAEMGVDAALEEAPVDRFAARPAQPTTTPAPLPAPERRTLPEGVSLRTLITPTSQTVAPPDETERAARSAAQAAATLDELREAMANFHLGAASSEFALDCR